tara:strand:+ start:4609 stop:5001 length:393 start_codon:yes stop_codon:yes gene_type:complete
MTDTKQTAAGSLKVGNYILLDNVAYTIKSIDISKTGKHGSTKCRIEAISLIDKRKVVKIIPSSDNVTVPIIEKKTAQVLSVQGDKANVMDTTTYETFDVDIPEDLKDDVKEESEVLYWVILDNKVIRQVK